MNIVIEFIKNENSLMSLHAALLLHIRVRNSSTRRFFSIIEHSIAQKNLIKNKYFENIICKYYLTEFSKNAN